MVWDIVVSDKKFVFSNYEKDIVLLAWMTGVIYWTICFYLYSPNIRLWRDKFSGQHFRKISWTLLQFPFLVTYSKIKFFVLFCFFVVLGRKRISSVLFELSKIRFDLTICTKSWLIYLFFKWFIWKNNICVIRKVKD